MAPEPEQPVNGAQPMLKLENTEKRDTLIAIEKKYQKQWADSHIFEMDAPTTNEYAAGSVSSEELQEKHPKHFGTFAYPYMNGTLHAGHSFTISKVEFAAGFARMEGKRVLFPLGYHCTGLPIKACADKLVKDVAMFGQNFEKYRDEEDEEEPAEIAPTQSTTKTDITKFSGKKSKAVAKTAKAKHQFQIMVKQNIPIEEVHKFADPRHWLEFFPPLAKEHLMSFGARIDWRRQFVTTDANPYYDAFVRWQMNRLREQGKIIYGLRYTVYSPKDGQPCMDHDRSEGEGVDVTEYTALKLRVKEWAPEAAELIKGKVPEDANVYFVPATLRPETMYGQVCCFVGPKITYGVFEVAPKEYYVVTPWAAWNMAFQGVKFKKENFPKDISEFPPVVELQGSQVVGTLVQAPLSIHTDGVRILPMETVLPKKGTGVVTSVPSDSPDDYATMRELAKKAEYYGIKKEWAELSMPEIIATPSYGNLTAKFLVEKMKINSPKDSKLLADAKDLAYKEGFFKGTMLMGDFKGEAVEVAKPKVKAALIESGQAFPYAEPSGFVKSRSGDECIAAYLPQWFINYGEHDPEWQEQVRDYVKNELETYFPETRNAFEAMVDWLNRWACARTYGLGSKLPWDKTELVEGLSDSTIYMSYYTIAHLLHDGLFGDKTGRLGIKAEQMIDEAWDCVFHRTEITEELMSKSGISRESFETMRREFEYWYPLNLRSSGKDLIGNHLTFFLYNHIALFPRKFWPKAIRCNGHLILNGEKMSKSTGNFLTLQEAVQKYGADAVRISLADAGDGLDDANFEESTANSSILRMHTLKEWCEEVSKDSTLRTSRDPFWDPIFENDINGLVAEARTYYETMQYKLALKSSLYDFINARDFYRESTTLAGIGMNKDLVMRFVELQALVLNPIAPHWSDYIWQEVLHKSGSIQSALFPTVPAVDATTTSTREYVRATTSLITSAEAAQLKKKDKGKTISYDPKKPKKITIYVAAAFPSWQDKYIDLIREDFAALGLEGYKNETNKKADKSSSTSTTKPISERVQDLAKAPGAVFNEPKKAMPFVQQIRKRLAAGEAEAEVLDRSLPFDEVKTLREMIPGLKKFTGCTVVDVVRVDEGKGEEKAKGEIVVSSERSHEGAQCGEEVMGRQAAEMAVPGLPAFYFENI